MISGGGRRRRRRNRRKPSQQRRFWVAADYEPSADGIVVDTDQLTGGAAVAVAPVSVVAAAAAEKRTDGRVGGRSYEIVGTDLRTFDSPLAPQKALVHLLRRASVQDLIKLRTLDGATDLDAAAAPTLRASRETRRVIRERTLRGGRGGGDEEAMQTFLRHYESQPRALFTGGSFPVLLRVTSADGATQQVREYAVQLDPVRRPTARQVRDCYVRQVRVRFHQRVE